MNKPVFLALEAANFSDELFSKIVEKFRLLNYSESFSEFDCVEVIYLRFARKVDHSFLIQFKNCKFVLCNATGIEHIDEFACSELGIRVISLRGETKFLESITATAEMTWLLLLAVIRRIIEATSSVREGIWDRNKFIGMQLSGRTLGVAGLGRNGRKVVRYAKAFEMHVLAYDPNVKSLPGVVMCNSLETLCAQSDFICITASSNEKTRRIFNERVLSCLRSHAVLVNTSRGEIVDEAFLLDLLKARKIGGYGTDVLTNEQHYSENLIFRSVGQLDNLVVTPHIGGVTKESWLETERFVVEKMLRCYEQ